MKLSLYLLLISIFFLSACKTQQLTNPIEPQTKVDISQMQGGMWVPSELEGMNETEMRILGSNMTASDIYSTTKPSLKDAVVHFNGGCTAEIISNQGLLLTNHHCGYGAIQSHSSTENDFLTKGFWAADKNAELPNAGMTVTFVLSMEDVTDKMFAGTAGLSQAAMEVILNKNSEAIKKTITLERDQKVVVKPFSNGNEFFLIVTEDYKDIRLVGTPPSSIGKFGADTDNWMWPRHTGDFALFRIYADKNNNPATFSKDNVPFKPKHFLPISLDGVEEGDFTLVFGFPGSTSAYLPAVAIEQIVNKLNPEKIAIREASLAIMDRFMRKDNKIKLQYSSKFASIANHWKKWIGESQGLTLSNAAEKKRASEKEFQQIVKEKGLTEYSNILSDFDRLYKEYGEVAQARNYWVEVVFRNIELLKLTFRLYQLEQTYLSEGEEAFAKARDKFIKGKEGFYKNFNAQVDQELFAKLMYMYDAKYPKTRISEEYRKNHWIETATKVYANTKLTSYDGLKRMLKGTGKQVFENLNKDKAYQIGSGLSEKFYQELNPNYFAVKDKLNVVQKLYTKALQEVFPNRKYFPDANSTLRVTYGQVQGYAPRDGKKFLPVSHVVGIMEKYVPDDYEFDVSQKLKDLYAAKEFGQYQNEEGKMPVNFIGTNHTSGGNSGSPVIDADGNLIGLNFDRVWEGTMSDYNYDASICRNIMVDVRYILFIIDKYAGASHLIDEMKLVHPKKQ